MLAVDALLASKKGGDFGHLVDGLVIGNHEFAFKLVLPVLKLSHLLLEAHLPLVELVVLVECFGGQEGEGEAEGDQGNLFFAERE